MHPATPGPTFQSDIVVIWARSKFGIDKRNGALALSEEVCGLAYA